MDGQGKLRAENCQSSQFEEILLSKSSQAFRYSAIFENKTVSFQSLPTERLIFLAKLTLNNKLLVWPYP